MKYLRGFLMAWGCFSWIPCPYKKWHDEDRDAMVATLPLVGTGLGLMTAVIWWILALTGAAPILTGALVTGAYFVMTGFIHLDGFMDVADAVMPRHPELEARRRILKDPHTGSFAAISMALMFVIFAASAAALSDGDTPGAGPGGWLPGALCLIAVVTTSRCVSAMTVILCRPMETSQYATTSFGRESSFGKAAPALVITVIIVTACLLAGLQCGVPAGGAGEAAAVSGIPAGAAAWLLRWGPAAGIAVSSAVCALTALIIGTLDRRSLGGMNGDISGHMITSGEMAGILAAAILIG